MTRILFLLTQDQESPSGLGRHWPLARELARRGHPTRIAALHPDFEQLDRKQFELDAVQVSYVAPMHVRKRGSDKTYYSGWSLLGVAARATWRLLGAALRQPADIVYVCKPHPMNSLAGLAARLIRGSRLWLDCDDDEAGSNRFSAGWQRAGVAFFQNWMPRRADRVTTNTRHMHDRLLGLGLRPDRVTYLPNGVARDRFSDVDAAKVQALRAELDLGDRPVVGYIGSMSLASHAIDLLLEAFQFVQRERPEAVLLMVGGGEDLPALRAQAERLGVASAVRFCGRVPPAQVPSYYALASVTVDPARADAAALGRSPLKLFESWAAGVPFVTADVGDRRAILGSPAAGLLAEAGNACSLAEAIRRVLSEPALAAALSQRGLEQVQSYYWDQLAARLASDFLESN